MSKIAVVYWSSTGHTALMADGIAEGIREAGGQAQLISAADFDGNVDEFAVIAFGCPAMGAESLEETEFEPMFAATEPKLSGKKIALFGSYGWGDGQWMRDWCNRCLADGAILFSDEGLICNDKPDIEALNKCIALGRALANW